ncbi:hypothetical protein Fmac_008376 [Flemingia macrophylla]|uniref:Transmembrane protein n=1 Tax=Flemingia macrophylla TaxID=520843 RepID=A0ABD1MX84_9FABA
MQYTCDQHRLVKNRTKFAVASRCWRNLTQFIDGSKRIRKPFRHHVEKLRENNGIERHILTYLIWRQCRKISQIFHSSRLIVLNFPAGLLRRSPRRHLIRNDEVVGGKHEDETKMKRMTKMKSTNTSNLLFPSKKIVTLTMYIKNPVNQINHNLTQFIDGSKRIRKPFCHHVEKLRENNGTERHRLTYLIWRQCRKISQIFHSSRLIVLNFPAGLLRRSPRRHLIRNDEVVGGKHEDETKMKRMTKMNARMNDLVGQLTSKSRKNFSLLLHFATFLSFLGFIGGPG